MRVFGRSVRFVDDPEFEALHGNIVFGPLLASRPVGYEHIFAVSNAISGETRKGWVEERFALLAVEEVPENAIAIRFSFATSGFEFDLEGGRSFVRVGDFEVWRRYDVDELQAELL